MANKYNIYKIPKSNRESLLLKLSNVDLEKETEVSIEDFTYTFYLSQNPDDIEVSWVKTFEPFLSPEHQQITNKSYYGVLLIEHEDYLYAISLGKSHFYLQPFCDLDFGLNFASRIINPKAVTLKNSKYFKSKKNKIIETYSENDLVYTSAESIYMLKGEPSDKEKWGNLVSFGRSVQLTTDTSVLELHKLITQIHETLALEPVVKIPMVLPLKNEDTILELDQQLYEYILSENTDGANIDQVQVIGVSFVFSGNDKYKLFLSGTRIRGSELEELSLADIKQFIVENNLGINDFQNIKVSIIRDEGKGYARKIKEVLDYVNMEGYYCLLEGTWHEFNEAYIDYLNEYVSNIQIEDIEENFNLAPGEIEDNLIEKAINEAEYKNLHREMERVDNQYTVELADLYKNGTIYFVKRGTPKKLIVAIDQALTTLNLLKSDEAISIQESDEINVKKLVLWLVFDRQNTIENLSQIGSLIFLIRISELKRLCVEYEYEFSVKINYQN